MACFSLRPDGKPLSASGPGQHWDNFHFSTEVSEYEGIAFAPDERQLALCSTKVGPWQRRHSCEQMLTLHLWQRDARQRWCCVTRWDCHTLADSFPLAFSPDSQLLAFPDGLGHKAHVRVLSTGHPGDPSREFRLPLQLPPEVREKHAEVRAVRSVQFNLGGRQLAVCMEAGVTLFHCHWRLQQMVIQWVPNPGTGPVRAVFSPDGTHCAMALGFRGHVQVWGECNSGPGPVRYLCKASLPMGTLVHRLAFSPDSSRLVIMSNDCKEGTEGEGPYLAFSSRLSCLWLLPEPEHPASD